MLRTSTLLLGAILFRGLCITNSMAQPVDSTLLVHYPFDGDALDAGVHEVHGNLFGPVFTTDRFGVPDHALLFAGVDDHLVADSALVLDTLVAPLTVSAWLRIDGWWNGTWAAVLSKSVQDLNSLQYRVVIRNNGTYWLAPYPDCYQFQGSGVPPAATWFHMTVSHDVDSITFYVDGVRTNAFACTTPVQPNSHPLMLGTDLHGVTEYFTGAMDDFRLYRRALKGDEVAAVHDGTVGLAPASASTGALLTGYDPLARTLRVWSTDGLPLQQARLLDLGGRVMGEHPGASASIELGIGDLPAGCYVLHATHRSAPTSIKVCWTGQ